MFHHSRLLRRRVHPRPARPIRGGFGWLRPVALAALLPLTAAIGSVLPQTSLPVACAQPQQVQPGVMQPQQPAKQASPLDAPLEMALEARQVYNQVNDYTCILISQERVKGKLLPEQVIQMTFRKNPFSVYMKWVGKEKTGQEVCYVQGRNSNKMRVLPDGIAKNFGWMSIAVDDPKVMQHSRHQITEAGFGNIIERCLKGWEAERPLNKTQVAVAEYEYNKRRCWRVECVHTAKDPSFLYYRTVVYFDKETKLPVRFEAYDWPRQGGEPGGDLLESFSYIELRFNTNPPEALFNH